MTGIPRSSMSARPNYSRSLSLISSGARPILADIYSQYEGGPLGNGVDDPVSTSSFDLDKICQEKSKNVAGQLLVLREIIVRFQYYKI